MRVERNLVRDSDGDKLAIWALLEACDSGRELVEAYDLIFRFDIQGVNLVEAYDSGCELGPG